MGANPTITGFISFIQFEMEIDASRFGVAGYGAPVVRRSYNVSVMTVNKGLQAIDCPDDDPTQPTMYAYAVYNLGGDRIINYANDPPGAPIVPGTNKPDGPGLTYFNWLRKQFNISGFVPGVISSSNDESTGQSLLVPEALSGLTLGDLQNLKTPYGRRYLEIAQDAGPQVWGLS